MLKNTNATVPRVTYHSDAGYNSPQFEAYFSWAVNVGAAQNGEAAGGKLGDHHAIVSAGAMADQELAAAVPAHYHTDVGIVRE